MIWLHCVKFGELQSSNPGVYEDKDVGLHPLVDQPFGYAAPLLDLVGSLLTVHSYMGRSLLSFSYLYARGRHCLLYCEGYTLGSAMHF